MERQEINMGTKVKPVQSTVIKDKAIIEQVVKEIRRRPTSERLAQMAKDSERLTKMIRK
jgi:capsular polysaccharide biosynthesis protein